MTSQAILDWGCYVPAHRLDGAAMTAMLGRPGPKRGRPVASYDEDTTTMAVEAARAVLARGTRTEPDLLLASSAPAYLVKSCAGTVHAALGLPESARAVDAMGATRSGVSALITALESIRPSLVLAADSRTEPVGSPRELSGGDASVALLIGSATDGPPRAEVTSTASRTVEVLDRWQLPSERFGATADERTTEVALVSAAVAAAGDALDRVRLEVSDLDRVVVASEHSRVAALVGRKLGVEVLSGIPGLGAPGAALAGLLLVHALEQAEAGARILLVSVADGADALVVHKTDSPDRGPTLTDLLAAATDMEYPDYLRWRSLIEQDKGRRPVLPAPAPAPTLRTGAWKYALHAGRCAACGSPSLPASVVCRSCGASAPMEIYPIAETPAVVVSSTTDWLAWTPVPPLRSAVVRFASGGEMRCEVADTSDDLAPGTPVRMVFRVLRTTEGVHNYFWKAAPARVAAKETKR